MAHTPTIKTYFDNRDGQMLSRLSDLFFHCEYDPEYSGVPYVLFSEQRQKVQQPEIIESRKTFLCGCCKQPLKICGGKVDGVQQFHFKHIYVPKDGECDYYEGVRYSESQIKAMIFNGRTEGPEHRRVKGILKESLLNEPNIKNVVVEEVAKKVGPTWRKPDVRADFTDKTVVFEVQLSPVFHHVILERNDAYRKNGWYICWLFDDIQIDDPLMRNLDAWANNNYNIFAFDRAAQSATMESGRLHLTVKYSRFSLEENAENGIPLLKDRWEVETLALSEFTFDNQKRMVYRFDSGKEKQECENEIQERKDEIYRKKIEKEEQEAEKNQIDELTMNIPVEEFSDDDFLLLSNHISDLSDYQVEILASEVRGHLNQFEFTVLNKWLSIFCKLNKIAKGNLINQTLKYLWGTTIANARQGNFVIKYVSLADFWRNDKNSDFYSVLDLLEEPINDEVSNRLCNLTSSHSQYSYFAPLQSLKMYYEQYGYIPSYILRFFCENRIVVRSLISAQMKKPFATDYSNLKQVANEVWNSCKEYAHLFLYIIERENLISEISEVKIKPGKKPINHYQRLKEYVMANSDKLSTVLRVKNIDLLFPSIQ
jgi:hypothetical protein